MLQCTRIGTLAFLKDLTGTAAGDKFRTRQTYRMPPFHAN